MTDFYPAEESYATAPPHVIPGHPYAWVLVNTVPTSGEIGVSSELEVHQEDASGGDRSTELATLSAGDLVRLTSGAGVVYNWVVSGAPGLTTGVFFIPGSGSGSLPPLGEQVTLGVEVGQGDAPAPDPDPEPPIVIDLDPPTSSNTKAEIVAWLLANGVTFDADADALGQMTKVELLGLVDDLTDDQVDLDGDGEAD